MLASEREDTLAHRGVFFLAVAPRALVGMDQTHRFERERGPEPVPGRRRFYRRWRRIELAWLVAAFAATLMMTYVFATVVSTDNGIRTEASQR